MSDLGSRISNLGSRISDLGSRISDLESRIGDLGSWISDLGSRISDLGSRISNLESRISNLGSRISDLGSRISNLGSRISNLGSRISDLESRISDLGSRISNLGSRISDLGSRISDLESRISDLESRICPLPSAFWNFQFCGIPEHVLLISQPLLSIHLNGKKRTSRPAVTAVNRRHFDGNWPRQMSMSWCIPINSASSQRVCTIVLSSTLWVIETSDPWCRRLGLRRCDGCGRNEQFIGLPILVQCENPELESLTPCNTQATGFHGFEHCSDDTWFILHLFLVG